jgi:DNA invertase Pin-like site-specific DNA recombinase
MTQPVLDQRVKAFSYIRFSTPQQALGDSLKRQSDKAAKYAAEHGLTLDTELKLTDAGVSGYRGANSKTGALGAFLKEITNGAVPRGSYLLVENLDRLTRTDIVTASNLFNQIILAGINLVTLTSGEVWSIERLSENPYGMIEITVELIRGNRESARKSQLVGDAKARKKQTLIAGGDRSKPYTRQTPAWLRWNDESKLYEPLPERAAIVLEIFERADAGDGIDRIAKDLNSRAVDTWGGRRGQRKADHWRGSYMRKIMMSPAPIGSFIPHTTTRDPETGARRDEPMDTVVGLFPAVVGEELYWRVRRRFATTAPRGRNARHDPKSIVAGITRCATCGNVVTRVSKGDYVYLVCSRANMRAQGCKYLAVPYGDVEGALRANVGWLIKEAPRGKSTAALDKEIAGLVTMELHYSGEASDLADLAAREKSPTARKRLREKEAELRETQARLRTATAERDTLTTASVRDRLRAVEDALLVDTLDVVVANQALKQAMSRIVLDPERARLEVYWHHAPESVQVIHFYTRHKVWTEEAYGISEYGPPEDTGAS